MNEHSRVRFLLRHRDELKRRLKGKATKRPMYHELDREITNEHQRQRHILLKHRVQDIWDKQQPIADIERQLSRQEPMEEVKAALSLQAMYLIETVANRYKKQQS